MYLTGYQEASRKHLLAGFLHGFRLYFHGLSEGSSSNNLVSASEHANIVDQRLAKEIQAGRIIGPFDNPPLHNLKASPLGVIPKKVQGEYRMIHHLSFPYGGSVNYFVPPEFCSVQYATVDDAVQIIKRLGRGCALATTDVRSAFRIIPVHPLITSCWGYNGGRNIMSIAASQWDAPVHVRPLNPSAPQWSG